MVDASLQILGLMDSVKSFLAEYFPNQGFRVSSGARDPETGTCLIFIDPPHGLTPEERITRMMNLSREIPLFDLRNYLWILDPRPDLEVSVYLGEENNKVIVKISTKVDQND